MVENHNPKRKGGYAFTRGQLTTLAGAFGVGSVLVFLVGVLIGQQTEERKLLKRLAAEPTVRIPVSLPSSEAPASAPAPGEQELTFYETLTTVPASESQTPEPDAQPAPQETPESRTESPPTPPQAPPEIPAEPAAPEKTWTVQVNAFPDENDAQRLMRRLRSKGLDAYVVSAKIRNRTWYRVRVGKLPTRKEAGDLQEHLEGQEGFKRTFITTS